MTNTRLLRKYIQNKGLKLSYIAEQLDIALATLARKIENESEFTANEIKKMHDILDLSSLEEREKIFFACNVEKLST